MVRGERLRDIASGCITLCLGMRPHRWPVAPAFPKAFGQRPSVCTMGWCVGLFVLSEQGHSEKRNPRRGERDC
ncbi:hypothetical protein [Chlamydiifrater volucris]|uniref:hypothetical protein n=1 Tax=Chlamydiifrater volucris TaxID=2681470 RepID=UPI001BD14BDF|nr:hypothetical protein [Chlamydiifrater volucris]